MEGRERGVRNLLGKLCRSDWEKEGEIGLICIPKNARARKSRLQRWVRIFAPPDRFCQLFVQKGIKFPYEISASSTSDLRHIISFPSVEVLEKLLPDVLGALSLDWMSGVANLVEGKWLHGTNGVDGARLEFWLNQFERLGERWIGVGLLKSLDFWPVERQKISFGISEALLAEYSRICVNRKRPGKSGDFLANVIRKQALGIQPQYPEIIDFWDLLASDGFDPALYKKVLLIEDGLFTGTETTNFFSGLLGLKHPTGRSWSTPALPNRDLLFRVPIVLRYAVATTLGIEIAKKFLREQALYNVEIGLMSGTSLIDNLTDLGKIAFQNGEFFAVGNSKVLRDSSNLIRTCFSDLFVWKTEERTKRAMTFCEEFGIQLFRQYLSWKGWTWDEDRIKSCGLGMCGLGLALAFNHSVPKASLPLLWMEGRVRFEKNKRELDWIPLFPNAKT